MALNRVSLTDTNKRKVKSVEQDQTARMCILILLNTLLKNKSMVTNSRIMIKTSRSLDVRFSTNECNTSSDWLNQMF